MEEKKASKKRLRTKSDPAINIAFSLNNRKGKRNTIAMFRHEGKLMEIKLFPETKSLTGPVVKIADKEITEYFKKFETKEKPLEDILLDEAITLYIQETYTEAKKSTKRTIPFELAYLKQLGDKVSDLTWEMYVTNVEVFKEGISSKTWKNRLSSTKKFFEWCVGRQYLKENPAKGITPPKKHTFGKRGKSDLWSDELFETMMDSPTLIPIEKMVLKSIWFTGIDGSDIFEMRVKHLVKRVIGKKSHWFLYKRREKAKFSQEIYDQPLDSRIVDDLVKLRKGKNADEKIFPLFKRSGENWTDAIDFSHNFGKKINWRMKQMGMEKPKDVKSIRHTFATRHAGRKRKDGSHIVPERQLKKWMGHTPSSTVLAELYIHDDSDPSIMT